jgi:serine/threonine protein kinase/Tfp pilus assembly protein PilF
VKQLKVEAGRRVGAYEIVAPLGRGGMGEVWRARDTTLDREIALKVLPAELADDRDRLARFEREAKLLASLNHSGIVTIHTVEEAAGVRFLTMELVEGETLEAHVPEGGLSVDRFFSLALLLVDAVVAAHDRGVVHRDLKPANVMVTADGRLKVLDFGLATRQPVGERAAEALTETGPLTALGSLVGTVPYMAPEQVKGRPADHRSDIFALGVILYEMACGRRPFAGGTRAEVVSAILRDTPGPVTDIRRDLPAELARAIARCLDKDPGRRFESACDLGRELQAASRAAPKLSEEHSASVAVMPFVDISPEHDQGYFCDGIGEEILNSLAKIKRLRLASRASSFQCRGTASNSRSIGSELGVATLLEGSVRKSGNRLRITVQLIDCASDSHLWSESYDRTLDDIFAIQEDIAHSIAQALRLTLTPEESSALQVAPAENAEAYDYYLRGRQLFYRGSRHDHGQARQMFRRAIEIDPGYVRAWAGLADACAYIYKHFGHDPAVLAEADSASRRALELGADSAEAHTSRGIVLWLSKRFDAAENAFEEAITLDPRLFDAPYLYGIYCLNRAQYNKAAEQFQRALNVCPDEYQSALLLGSVLRGAGRANEAMAAFRHGVEVARRHLEVHPDEARAWYLGAIGMIYTGDVDTGLEWAEKARSIDPENPLLQYNLCAVHAYAGRLDEAAGFMEEAVRLGYSHVESLEADPDLEAVRSHPRFRALIDRLRAS